MKGSQYFFVAYLLLLFLVVISVRILFLGTFQVLDRVSVVDDVNLKYNLLTMWICVFVSAPCILIPGIVWVFKLYKLGISELKS